jgi:Chromo (CHRromatin Organisation MOdifier) domain
LAEFAYNNSCHSVTGLTPFFANNGAHPDFGTSVLSASTSVAPNADEFAAMMQKINDMLTSQIVAAQDQQARYYDRKHEPMTFSVGDKVWLMAKNIKTRRPNKKLDHQRLGPFTIIMKRGLQSYRLDLPEAYKIHPVFHVSLLERYITNTIPGRVLPPPPPVEVDGDEEYEAEAILDSRKFRGQLQYLVKWSGYDDPNENTWEPAKHLLNAPLLLGEFHRAHPDKPGPPRYTKHRALAGARIVKGGNNCHDHSVASH